MVKWSLFPAKPKRSLQRLHQSQANSSWIPADRSENAPERSSISSVSHEAFLASKGIPSSRLLESSAQYSQEDSTTESELLTHLLFNPSSLASEKAELERSRRSNVAAKSTNAMDTSIGSTSMDVALPSISNAQNKKKEVAVMEAELTSSLEKQMVESSKLSFLVKQKESQLRELRCRLQEFGALTGMQQDNPDTINVPFKRGLVGVSRAKRVHRAQLLVDIAETRETCKNSQIYSKVLMHMLRRDEACNIQRQREITEKEGGIRGVKRERNKLRLILRDLEDMKRTTSDVLANMERNHEMKRASWQSQLHALKVKRELAQERARFRKKMAMDHKLRLLAMRGDLDEAAENELKQNKRQVYARQLSVIFARSVSVSNMGPTMDANQLNSNRSAGDGARDDALSSPTASGKRGKYAIFSEIYKRLSEKIGHFDPDDFVNRFSQQLNERRSLQDQIDVLEVNLEAKRKERMSYAEELRMLRYGDSRNAAEKEAINKLKYLEGKLNERSTQLGHTRREYQTGKTLIFKIREALYLLSKKVHRIRVPDRYKVNTRLSVVHDSTMIGPLEAQLVGMLRAMAIKDDGIVESKQIVDPNHSGTRSSTSPMIAHIPVINRDQLKEVEEHVIRLINSPAGNNIRINRQALQERMAHATRPASSQSAAGAAGVGRGGAPPGAGDEPLENDEDEEEEPLSQEQAEQAFLRYDRANRHVIKAHYLPMLLKDLGLYVGEGNTRALVAKLANLKQEVALHAFLRWINSVAAAKEVPSREELKAKCSSLTQFRVPEGRNKESAPNLPFTANTKSADAPSSSSKRLSNTDKVAAKQAARKASLAKAANEGALKPQSGKVAQTKGNPKSATPSSDDNDKVGSRPKPPKSRGRGKGKTRSKMTSRTRSDFRPSSAGDDRKLGAKKGGLKSSRKKNAGGFTGNNNRPATSENVVRRPVVNV